VYRVTKSFPENERYGLVGQLRRSAVSVPSNIAEGQGRATRGEFLQFLGHAQGSLFELETQIIISAKLGYIADESEERLKSKITEVARILNGLLTSLGAKTRPSTTKATHPLSTTLYPLTNNPTIDADIRFAIVPAIIALKPSFARS
jgi:four helix bundle protein